MSSGLSGVASLLAQVCHSSGSRFAQSNLRVKLSHDMTLQTAQQTTREEFRNLDYLIIGGGTAGCVVGSRISEQRDLQVLMLEEGMSFSPATEPSDIGDFVSRAYLNSAYMWNGLTTIPNPDLNHPQGGVAVPYQHGRVLGGGSSVNGMNVHRGLPEDYDEWTEFGVTGWSWVDVLPFFRKLESDADMDGPLHGKTGPLGVQRIPRSRWSTFEQAVEEDWRRRGVSPKDDLNGAEPTGHFPIPLSIRDGRRISTARAYLTDSVRARRNLRILSRTCVSKLLLRNGRVIGVEATRNGVKSQLFARHVVLCAGSFMSPLLLQRSGIGDGDSLREIGVESIVDRPGVGANLQNHPSMFLCAYLPKASRVNGRRPVVVATARYSSNYPRCQEADMMSTTLGMVPDPTASNPLGRRLATVIAIVQKVYSRGEVRPTRHGDPKVMGNMLSDERDLYRLMAGFQIIREQLCEGPAASLVDNVFVPLATGRTDDSIITTLVNRLGAMALDSSKAVRRRIIATVGLPVEAVPRDGPALADWVRRHNAPGYHSAGTCRMGHASDANAVVDSGGRVIGVSGLSIADASIFPTLMRSGTYIPTVMAAEKIAATILKDQRHLKNSGEL